MSHHSEEPASRPVPLRVSAENIPASLTAKPQWVLWEYEWRNDDWTKPLFTPAGAYADSTDAETWSAFDAVLAAYRAGGWDGIGYIHLPEDNLTGADADHCRDPETGETTGDDAKALLELDTYTEVSPSGTGLRAFAFGKKPGRKCKRGGFEMYDGTTAKGKPGGRFLTVTGNRLADSPHTINERQEAIDRVYRRTFGEEQNGKSGKKSFRLRVPQDVGVDLGDEELLRRMFSNEKNGAAIQSLFKGDTSGYKSASEADGALACHLAFWCNKDYDRIERLFNLSELGKREKWTEREDYRRATIESAIETVKEGYEPRAKPTVGSVYFGDTKADDSADHLPAGEAPAQPGEGARPDGGGSDSPPRPPSDGPRPFPKPQACESWTDPHRLARLLVDDSSTTDGRPTLVQWRDEYHRWERGGWRPMPDTDLDALVARHCRTVFVGDMALRTQLAEAAEKEGKEPKALTIPAVTGRLKGDVKVNLSGLVNWPDCGIDAPFWLRGDAPPDPTEVISAPNGLFSILDVATGRAPFLPPTPDFFTFNPLNFPVPLGEQDPPRTWLACLEQWFNGDAKCILGLQEWLGYLLTTDTSAHKILLLVGPPRSGKGTIINIINELVGPGNVASTTFASLGENFGLEDLIGKRVAIIPDARLSARTDIANVVERLLSISGEDPQTVNRKNRRRITTRMKVRFVLATNEIPSLPDASGALASRFHILPLPNSFLGKEDKGLKQKLRAELPAILVWAAKGYVRARCQSMTFTQNDGAEQYQRELENLSSPVRAFVRERCSIGPTHEVLVNELFSEWKDWNEVRNSDPGREQLFGRNLRAAYPHIKDSQPWRTFDGKKKRVRVYLGVGLRPREAWGDEDNAAAPARDGTRSNPTYACAGSLLDCVPPAA